MKKDHNILYLYEMISIQKGSDNGFASKLNQNKARKFHLGLLI